MDEGAFFLKLNLCLNTPDYKCLQFALKKDNQINMLKR